MHESGKWKWSCSVVSDSLRPHGLQPTRLLHPWDFPGKSIGVGCHCLLLKPPEASLKGPERRIEDRRRTTWDPERESVSCSVMPTSLRPHGLQPTRFLCPWDFPGKDTGVVCHFLLQGSFWLGYQTQVSCTADRFFTDWATREAHLRPSHTLILAAAPLLWNFVEEIRMQDCYCLDPHHVPLSDYITSPYSQGSGDSSWGANLLCSPFAWQSNKTTLFFSSITLSPYFCLALAHRKPRFWHHFSNSNLPMNHQGDLAKLQILAQQFWQGGLGFGILKKLPSEAYLAGLQTTLFLYQWFSAIWEHLVMSVLLSPSSLCLLHDRPMNPRDKVLRQETLFGKKLTVKMAG